MEVLRVLYDSENASETGQRVVELVRDRPAAVPEVDLGTGDRADARREAMLTVGQATRIGGKPDALFDETGTPDFSDGVIVTEDDRGRRDLHLGTEAVAVLTGE